MMFGICWCCSAVYDKPEKEVRVYERDFLEFPTCGSCLLKHSREELEQLNLTVFYDESLRGKSLSRIPSVN